MTDRAKIEEVCQKIIPTLVPTEAERNKVNDIINFTKKGIESEISSQKINADLFLGGSVGKDTWLRGNYDIDFFIRFGTEYKEEELSMLLSRIIKSVFVQAEQVHGSRDYYKVNFKGYELEFIPVYKIKDPKDAKNSMDASPFHVIFVKEHIKKKGLSDQMRLMKAFAKANNVYGAESYLSGFSGYVLELLTIHCGSFYDFLDFMEICKPKLIVDISKHYPKEDIIFKNLPEAKLKSPIILIDPLLKTRNAAASLDYESFSKIMYSSRLFIRNPSPSMFLNSEMTLSKIKKLSEKRGTILVTEQVKSSSTKNDIFMAKLTHALGRISSLIEQNDISIYSSGIINGKEIIMYFELDTLKLSKQTKKMGPPVWIATENFDSFLEKNPEAYVENTFLVFDKKREFTDISKFVLKAIKEGLNDVQ